MKKVKSYLSLIKFTHTIFAMPFALIGFFLGLKAIGLLQSENGVGQWHLNKTVGWGYDRQLTGAGGDIPTSSNMWNDIMSGKNELLIIGKYLGLVILCMIFARSAAMAFNRFLDRKFDALNPRTAIREIPSGILKANSVLLFTIVNCLLFVACTYFINRICLFLSPIALLVVLGYSYTKRFTPLCHLILGIGLSLAPIGAYLAVTGQFNVLPILFSLAVIFWVSGFDIIYALQDEEFDKSQRLYSIPASLGKSRALGVSRVLHLFSILAVIAAGTRGNFGWFYSFGAIVFIGMLAYQHSIVKLADLKRVNIAFMTANGIASVVFAVFVIADLLVNNNI